MTHPNVVQQGQRRARLGGCLLLVAIFVVGVLCGMTVMIVGG